MSIVTWVGGIAATIIAALVIWWFTHPGGILVEEPPPPKPIVRILDCDASNVYVGERSQATFTVYNEGEVTAQRCEIEWKPVIDSPRMAQSYQFSLMPEETKQISMSSVVYDEPGEFVSTAVVSWLKEGSDQPYSYQRDTSDYFYKTITVYTRY